MECSAFRRIKGELNDLKEANDNTCLIELIDDDWSNLKAEIAGPMDTPYEGGKFELSIKIPTRYPFIGPTIYFITKIWHPNISFTSGYICLDVLYDAWSASMTLRTSLLSIQALMSSPEPNSPEETIAAELYIKSPTLYKLAAQHWTHVYANGPKPDVDFGQEIKNQLLSGLIDEHLANVLLAYYNTYTNGHQTSVVTLDDLQLGWNQIANLNNLVPGVGQTPLVTAGTGNFVPITARRAWPNREMILTVEARVNRGHNPIGNFRNHLMVNNIRNRNHSPRSLLHRRRRIIIRERVLLPDVTQLVLPMRRRGGGRVMQQRTANYVIHHINHMLRHRRHALRTFILRHL